MSGDRSIIARRGEGHRITAARERRVHRDARELSDAVDPDRIWTHSDEHWYARLASSLLATLPVGDMLDGPERKAVLASLAGYLDWTIARNAPPWRKPGRRDKADSDLFEWTRRVGSLVGRVLSVARLAASRMERRDAGRTDRRARPALREP